jgi:hypothetical protein
MKRKAGGAFRAVQLQVPPLLSCAGVQEAASGVERGAPAGEERGADGRGARQAAACSGGRLRAAALVLQPAPSRLPGLHGVHLAAFWRRNRRMEERPRSQACVLLLHLRSGCVCGWRDAAARLVPCRERRRHVACSARRAAAERPHSGGAAAAAAAQHEAWPRWTTQVLCSDGAAAMHGRAAQRRHRRAAWSVDPSPLSAGAGQHPQRRRRARRSCGSEEQNGEEHRENSTASCAGQQRAARSTTARRSGGCSCGSGVAVPGRRRRRALEEGRAGAAGAASTGRGRAARRGPPARPASCPCHGHGCFSSTSHPSPLRVLLVTPCRPLTPRPHAAHRLAAPLLLLWRSEERRRLLPPAARACLTPGPPRCSRIAPAALQGLSCLHRHLERLSLPAALP